MVVLMYVRMGLRTYVCVSCVVGISSEQFAVLEQKLEKSCATEKALRAEVTLWKTELQEVSPLHPFRPHPPSLSW